MLLLINNEEVRKVTEESAPIVMTPKEKSDTAHIADSTTLNKAEKKSSDKLYQFYINNNDKNINEYHFKDNKVDTTKYNIFTFLPKALLFQFMRLANVYFLICAIIQCIPAISPLGAATAVVPLVVVLSVSLIREAIEDYQRSQLDKEQNSEPAEVYNCGIWENTTSGHLRIGEIVEVRQDATFPADLILIDSELPEGICFIETGTLDGEKTLKLKSSPKQTAGCFNIEGKKSSKFSFQGSTICDHPNPELYQLNGKMEVKFQVNDSNDNTKKEYNIPLDAKQLLLKGAKLRNTQWIIGIVVYTGHNCKIMKNAKEPRIKYSSVESLMNQMLIFILILQSVFCIICAILRGIYYKKNIEDNPFLNYTDHSYGVEGLISYFTYMLLLNTMIPISLIITLEIVKLIQGAFISVDAEGYSRIRDKLIKPNSVSLNEELGLVNYIFSDKTGTLTCNKMMFKFCVIGNVCYEFLRGTDDEKSETANRFRTDEGIIPFSNGEMYKSTISPSNLTPASYPSMKISGSYQLDSPGKCINEFWQALALCHDCTIQNNDKGEEEYIGMSPDSIELVKSARLQGFALTESGTSSLKRLKLGDDGKEHKDFERFQIIEFSSDRKRESVIVKDGSVIKLYIKGADSIIEERLSSNTNKEVLDKCKSYVNQFSAKGYRTLFIGMRILTQSEYDAFAKELNDANLSLEGKDEKVANAYKLVEKDIYLIGATIVEDKLQDKVPETIRDLRLAGIKIWMLTGDKMNTAYNIGLSCNLINKDLKTFQLEGIEVKKNEKMEVINKEEREQVILNFAKEYNKYKGEFDSMTKVQFGILVDEKALLTINQDEDIQTIFLNIAKDAVAVICCRVSPLQKSQVVKMMKAYDKKAITLAIGDGGNDVSMIMEAHIGIGIYGEEGMRAVQSGDYAIGEFKILHRLLLFHGRINYLRNSELVLYFFYKNFVFTMIQFIYGFYNNFSGQTIIDDWFITLFNLLFTSLPLGVRACLDIDVRPEDGTIIQKMQPFLYSEMRSNPKFTHLTFGLTLLKGTIHCMINYFYVIYVHEEHSIDDDGHIGGLWFVSVNMFTNILLIVTLDLIVYTKYETWINWVILGIITGLAYAIFLIIVHYCVIFNSVATMAVAFASPSLWLTIIFVGGTCFAIDFILYSFNFNFRSTMANMLQKRVSQGNLSEEDLPDIIKEKLALYDVYKGEKQIEADPVTILNSDRSKKNTDEVSKVKLEGDHSKKISLELEENKLKE